MADEDELSVSTSASTATTSGGVNWAKYVSTFLPMERSTEFSKDELAVEDAVVRIIGPDVWNSLNKDLRINIMRGNAHEKERLKVTCESAKNISAWRAKLNVDADFLRLGPLPGSEVYFTGWPTRVAGLDAYGHPILYDRFSLFDVSKFLSMDESDFFRFRTQALESLVYLKQEISAKVGARVSKHVYILDLAGLDATKHFTSAMQKKVRPVMKMSADMYPETLWTVWLINAPASFRFIWAVVRAWLDPVIRAKVRMWGSVKPKWHAAMAECGVTLASLPAEFGGTAPSEALTDILHRSAAKAAEKPE
jgi:hypothetical protein